jgi:hypothetical protein
MHIRRYARSYLQASSKRTDCAGEHVKGSFAKESEHNPPIREFWTELCDGIIVTNDAGTALVAHRDLTSSQARGLKRTQLGRRDGIVLTGHETAEVAYTND